MERKPKADLALMFCSLIWGVTFVVVKNALDESSVFLFLAVRFSIAAVIMALLQMDIIRRIEPQEIFAGMRLAFFMFAGYCFQTAGLQYTTAANSGFVTGSSVVLVPLLLAVFWGRRLTNWIYVGAFAALVGLYFLTVPSEGLRYLNRGDVLTFVGAGFYAVHIILVGEYTQEHSVRALSLIQVAGCAVMAWPLTGFSAAIHWQPIRFAGSWELWLGIVICAVFATAVAFTVQLWGQQYTSPGHAAILFALEPVFAVITSYLALHERLTSRAMAGAGMVAAGILLAELLGAPTAPESPEPVFEGRIYFKPWWRKT
ncbi:MAG TPA: DMT family transporter [Candidatus Eisenbacteria bacterium]|nr:DMT family transporter [Candidatus Eisenbacteria bacterium]